MNKIRWLRPTKEQQKIMDAERKAICNLTAPSRRTSAKHQKRKREMTTNKPIIDACCGSRMFWFDPKNPIAVFVDKRILHCETIWKSTKNDSVRKCNVEPDVVADFRNLPFADGSFWHVVFDPPHLVKVGDNAWMAKKYGKLPKDFKPYLKAGFDECWRVLKKNGTLVFKWNENDIRVCEILDAIGRQPLYGHKSGKQSKTHWLVFFKEEL